VPRKPLRARGGLVSLTSSQPRGSRFELHNHARSQQKPVEPVAHRNEIESTKGKIEGAKSREYIVTVGKVIDLGIQVPPSAPTSSSPEKNCPQEKDIATHHQTDLPTQANPPNLPTDSSNESFVHQIMHHSFVSVRKKGEPAQYR